MAQGEIDSEVQQRLLDRHGREFQSGEVIFRDGESAVEAFLLHSGRVRLIKRIGAVERGLRVLKPGDLFGESALVDQAPRNRTAVAIERTVVLALDAEAFHQVLLKTPEVAARVVRQIIGRLRDAEDQIEILMERDSQSKVVAGILKLAQQAAPGGNGPVSLALSPMELSTHIGLDVDAVKRTVQQLRDSGYVNIVDERVEVPDLDAVRELVSLLAVKDQIKGGESRPER